MANLPYQGPLPFPPGSWIRSQPYPGVPFVVKAPKFLQGAGAVIFVLDPVLPPGLVGYSYSQTLTAGGGIPAYTFAVTAGVLPGGLSLNSSTGVLSGTPSAAGTFSFTVTATDSQPQSGSQAFTVSIGGPLVFGATANSGFTG